jgi:hypothetical protein
MKKIPVIMALLFGALFGALPLASATTFYTNDWGSVKQGNPPANNNGILQSQYGWTVIASSQNGPFVNGSGEYVGTFAAPGATDPANGLGLPTNTAFFTGLSGTNQTGQGGMIYTTDTSGAGTVGDSVFSDINNPMSISNLTLNVEVRDTGGNLTNYFAVLVEGQWYVATSYPFPSSVPLAYPQFTNATLVYTNSANVWNNLTINGTTNITIGSVASLNLSATITGIGIVELANTNLTGGPGDNYNLITINQGVIPPVAPTITGAISQTVFAGGGASFLASAAGTPTLVYRWSTNAVTTNNINNGGRVSGATGNMLTITNVNADDGIPSYNVIVTNLLGRATNSGMTLTVLTRDPGLLYAELFPFAAPIGTAGNLPLGGAGGVGWAATPAAGGTIIFQNTTGIGACFSYNGTPATNAYYTTITNDTGPSGLPFPAINPASIPAVTLQAAFTPGNGAGGAAGATTSYWLVQMSDPSAGTNWYSTVTPIPILLTGGFQTNQFAFTNAAASWNNVTLTNDVVTIGSQASSALAGNITGAGLMVVHHDSTGASMNFENFEIITNALAILPPVIGADYPIDVGVPSGGGASFGVATVTGSQPFGYYWETNGPSGFVVVHDGGRVSGSTTATLTIANLNANDSGLQIIAFVTNSAGTDQSDAFTGNPTMLTVTNGPVGEIYLDQFPFVGPVTGNYPIGSVGWGEAVSGNPFPVFRRGTAGNTDQGDGAVFAFFGSAATNVYYTTTATDTNQSGLPFPNINLASYTDLSISVDIAPNSAGSANVTAYLAVQLNGTDWYVAASALLGPNTASNSAYSTYPTAFVPTAALWKNLTVTPGTGGTIGSTAASNLKGVMTGVGLVFVTVGSGGTFNFDNLLITGTGVGGVNAGPLTGGNVNLTWVGNPVVRLQSNTNLSTATWQDVPNTLGLYSQPVSVTGPQKFFRLKTP